MQRYAEQVLEQVRKAVVGKDEILVKVLMAILAGGHILLEDIPGVGKTTLALAFSRAMQLKCSRMQFTPDVLPSDVTGYSVYGKDGRLMYQPGAVLCNLFLADEINRTSSKTQSALLEVMEEGAVTKRRGSTSFLKLGVSPRAGRWRCAKARARVRVAFRGATTWSPADVRTVFLDVGRPPRAAFAAGQTQRPQCGGSFAGDREGKRPAPLALERKAQMTCARRLLWGAGACGRAALSDLLYGVFVFFSCACCGWRCPRVPACSFCRCAGRCRCGCARRMRPCRAGETARMAAGF